jgi:hypothetical protein
MRYWSQAVYDLRLSEEAFFDLTPAQFSALMRRHKSAHQTNEFLFAQLTSVIANTAFRHYEKATVPNDFMITKLSDSKPKDTPGNRVRMTKKRRENLAFALGASLDALIAGRK